MSQASGVQSATGRARRASARHEVRPPQPAAIWTSGGVRWRRGALRLSRSGSTRRCAVLGRRVRQDGRAGPALARAAPGAGGLIAAATASDDRCASWPATAARGRSSCAPWPPRRGYRAGRARRLPTGARAVGASALATTLACDDGDRSPAAAAVARQRAGRIAALAGLPPLTLGRGRPRVARAGRARSAGYRRAIDLDRRLDRRLLRLAGAPIRATRIERLAQAGFRRRPPAHPW